MITTLFRTLGREHAGPLRRTLALMVGCAIAEGLSYAFLVPVLRILFGDAPSDVGPWLIGFGASVAVYAVLRYVSDLSGFRVGTSLLRGVYHRLGDQLVRLPLGWYRADLVGELSATASRGVLQSMSVIAHMLAPFVSACVTPLTIVVVMTAYDLRMGLAAAAAIPVVTAVQMWSARTTAATDIERAARDHEATARVVEYLQAQPVLRAGGRTVERFRLLDDSLDGIRRASRRSTLAAVPGIVGTTVTVQAAFTALLALGTYLVIGGSLAVPDMLALVVLAGRCAEPLLSLSEIGGKLRAARGELTRLDAFLSTPPLPEPVRPARPHGHDIKFDSVAFRRDGRTVIDGLSLAVPQRRRFAVVGPSGAGKSTLLQLLARFHDVDAGSVRIGGVDVRDIATDVLMSQIAVVFQDVYLFDETLEENVRLGRADATDDEVRAAGAAAGLDEVIERLPDGWSSRVGEGGAMLSGGERQRVSIARALLKDAPIVLLDETTSALDPENEAVVRAGLERLTAGRTVLMVAHRLHTVRDADRIVFLDRGRIVEEGTHDELVRRGGRYTQFWEMSIGPASPIRAS